MAFQDCIARRLVAPDPGSTRVWTADGDWVLGKLWAGKLC